jgi:hypothetical protein
MKSIVLALTALFAAGSAFAQGKINFATRVTGQVDAPVRVAQFAGDPAPVLADGAYHGQLYAGAPGGALAAIGVPVPFRTGTGQGYITAGGSVQVAGIAGGSPASVELRAWQSASGVSYEAAAIKGSSLPIQITLGGGGTPPTPDANLVGLQGFTIVVPEPSIAALGLLGAGLLVIRRKK